MKVIVGWIFIIFGGALYLAQVVSSINFPLAQRLGIQESSERSDKLLQTAERNIAYWDLFTLLWLPLSGVLIIMNHNWWPIVALLGGAIYLDAAGREAVKNISFRQEGIKMGGPKQKSFFFATYIVMAIIGVLAVSLSITSLAKII